MLDMVRQNLANLLQRQGPSAGAPRAKFDDARREHQAGNTEKAAALYRQSLLAEPNNAQAWYLLGAALTQFGQLDEARSTLRQATSINPRHAEAHNHLGVVLAQQGSVDEAIASFRRALELKPTTARPSTILDWPCCSKTRRATPSPPSSERWTCGPTMFRRGTTCTARWASKGIKT
ncbi:MAG TPA: tetratricopeptide repeat protein [Pirellulales bacterium]